MEMKDLNYLSIASVIILAVGIISGTAGNVTSLIIWSCGRKCSKAACSTYFKLLAIADLFVLLVPALKFLLDLCKIPLSHVHVVFCKFYGFSELFGSQISAWLVVCLTFERMLSLCFPFKFRTKCARRRAYISAVIIVIFATGLNSIELENRIMFQYKYNQTNSNNITETRNKTVCVTSVTNYYKIMNTVSFIWFLSILPFAMVTSCNCIIVAKIVLMRKMTNFSSSIKRHNNAASFTKLCFVIGILYCISTLPLTIHSLNLYRIIKIVEFNTIPYYAFRMLSYTCFYINNSVNFFLFCVTGSDFRNDLKNLLTCFKTKNKRKYTGPSTSAQSIERGTSLTSFSCSDYPVVPTRLSPGTL